MAIAGLHYAYDQVRQLHVPPPAHAADIWPEYMAMLDAVEPERLHQRIHAGHCCWVIPEEERFVTKSLIERTCMVGTKDDIIDRLRALQAAGLDQVMILPSLETRYDVLERVAKEVIPNV
jgi:alkanesulfonate monooxygenase SsuD/methylene tetrahydromethanopterin reductase-like flavin-dependent oxidoreductase (luciferase family)